MNRRIALGAGAALLVAGVVVLLFALRGGGDDEDPPASNRSARRAGPSTDGPRSPIAGADGGVRGRPGGGDGGDRVVRDHRSNGKPFEPGTRERPDAGPELRDVEPVVTGNVRFALRPIIKRCTEAAAAGGLGPKASLTAVVVVHVAGGTLIVDEVDVQTSDVSDPGIADCVVKGATGLSVKAAGQTDVASTTMTHGFDLRR